MYKITNYRNGIEVSKNKFGNVQEMSDFHRSNLGYSRYDTPALIDRVYQVPSSDNDSSIQHLKYFVPFSQKVTFRMTTPNETLHTYHRIFVERLASGTRNLEILTKFTDPSSPVDIVSGPNLEIRILVHAAHTVDIIIRVPNDVDLDLITESGNIFYETKNALGQTQVKANSFVDHDKSSFVMEYISNDSKNNWTFYEFGVSGKDSGSVVFTRLMTHDGIFYLVPN